MSRDKKQVWLTPEEWAWIRSMRAAKTCAEKRAFTSKGLALREIWRMMNSAEPPKHKLRAYQCPACQAWHLTKKDQWGN